MHVREEASPAASVSVHSAPRLWPVRYRLRRRPRGRFCVPRPAAPRLWPVRYRRVGLTFALSMLLYVDRVAISTARGPITSELGLSDTQFGSVLAAFVLGYAPFQTPGGARTGRRAVRLGAVRLCTGLRAVPDTGRAPGRSLRCATGADLGRQPLV